MHVIYDVFDSILLNLYLSVTRLCGPAVFAGRQVRLQVWGHRRQVRYVSGNTIDQPPPTCPRNGCCPLQKHYARGRINQRCINSYKTTRRGFRLFVLLGYLLRVFYIYSLIGIL
jgi:hypothetical protein